jgi:probable rRNA maturation factor
MPLSEAHKPVRFHYLEPVAFRNKQRIKEIVVQILKSAGLKPGDINYIFCSDEYLRAINIESLGHDDYTDIITFDLSDIPGVCSADIYISVDRVRENAGLFHTSLQAELSRVIFHGALHLAGFKDKLPDQVAEMRAQEDYYLKLLYKRST